jgi:hypothetical protein
MQQTMLAPPLILADGRLRTILDRAAPHSYPMAPLDWPTAIAYRSRVSTGLNLIAVDKRQLLAFAVGFVASLVIVAAAVKARPFRSAAATAAPVKTAAAPVKATAAPAGRTDAFAAPELLPRIRVAKITVIASDAPPALPTPVFAQDVVPVTAAPASLAPAPIPAAVAPRPVKPPVQPAAANRAPAKVASATSKPATARPPRRSPAVGTSLPAPPVAVAHALPPSTRRLDWSDTWMRSTLGMNPDRQ